MTLYRFPNGLYQYTMPVFWTGHYSNAIKDGAIAEWLIEYFNNVCEEKNVLLYIPCSDGDITCKSLEDVIFYAKENNSKLIVGTVAQRFQDFSNFLFLPQDDGIFNHGLIHYFPENILPPWEHRKEAVFWRGACSADYKNGELLRRDVVANLIDYPYADVKLIELWHEDKPIPKKYFAPKASIDQFMMHKYILIIDGNGISSSHTWVFASGAVPIMITNNEFWFKKYLVPFEHYVPVKYDLSDLIEQIEWLRNHDDKAKQIAINARAFANTVFSSGFQKKYLEDEIQRILKQ
jgi:hypothetical protein